MRMEAADQMRTPRARNASFDHARRYAVIAGQFFRGLTLPTAIPCAGFRAADVRRLFREFRLFEVQRRPSECSKHRCFRVAGGLGFEPRLTESESAVLPLNYPPMRRAQA